VNLADNFSLAKEKLKEMGGGDRTRPTVEALKVVVRQEG
jgi:hypothetical protein